MTGLQRALLYLATLALTTSGAAYAWMRYCMEGDDPFSAYNHPWQPLALDGHLLAAPLLVFAVGWIFQEHVLDKLALGAERRLTGVLLVLLFAVLVVSGYGRTVADGASVRAWLSWIHGLCGGAWFALLVAHVLLGSARDAQDQPAPAAGQSPGAPD